MANCYACKKLIVFDNARIGKNGRPIPLDPETQAPHDCPMREKRTPLVDNVMQLEEKDDHGNESYTPPADLKPVGREIKPSEYVDHTTAAKGQSKVKIFCGGWGLIEEEYNLFLKENHGKIKTQGAQFQYTGQMSAIALYYEETKQ